MICKKKQNLHLLYCLNINVQVILASLIMIDITKIAVHCE